MNRLLPKLLAVAAAVVLWAGVRLDNSGRQALEASVRYLNVPPELEINPDRGGSVTVLVEGPLRRLAELEADGLALQVDCTRFAAGQVSTIDVTAATLGLPTGVRFLKAVPSQVRVELETTAYREVTVIPDLQGVAEAGYQIDYYNVDPAELRVAGPESRIVFTESVSTDPIDLTGQVGPRTIRTTAYLSDPYLRFVDGSTVEVELSLRPAP